MHPDHTLPHLPAEVQEQFDDCCRDFAEAWKGSEEPCLEQMLARVDQRWRRYLMVELLKIELANRASQIPLLTDAQLCDRHAALMPDFADVLQLLRAAAAQPATEREQEIRQVVAHCRWLRAQGTPAPDDDILARHPQLLPELAEELRKLRIIAAAHDAAPPVDTSEQVTVDHTPTRKESRGLQIRCPHCSNFVEVISDTAFAEICCSLCGSSFSLVARDEATRMATPLKSIDRFDLIARLGVGGFGTVWKAHDRELDRTVAVKIPRRGRLSDAEIDQFFREARAAAQLRHPHIVPVYEVGRENDTLFIVSEFIRGVTLSDWLTGNTLSSAEVVQLCIPVVDALHHAHQCGVVHRDLKPSNILIDEAGAAHLTDFGLAKREAGEITMTVDGQILGTPAYMSPEQAGGRGHWTDRRTDLYSMGVILFQLLTGELPFRGNAQMQIHQRLTEEPTDPRRLNRNIPRDLATICLKCLEREPGGRYNSAAELSAELSRFLRGEPIQARPLSRPVRLGRWVKRQPLLATIACLVVLLAIGGPTAALIISRLLVRERALVAEKNHVIERYQTADRAAAQQLQALTAQLDVWEGKAKLTDFWPPSRSTVPRATLISHFYRASSQKLTETIQRGGLPDAAVARGYVGLGLLAQAIPLWAESRAHFTAARDRLAALYQAHPHDLSYAKALAECHTQLALLTPPDDRAQTAGEIAHAGAIFRALATADHADLVAQIDLLEAELQSALVKGFEPSADHLRQVQQLSAQLGPRWPTDADGIYELACYLTRTEPILARRARTEAGGDNISRSSP